MAPSECLPGSSFCAKAPRVQVPPMPLPLTLTRDNSLEVAGATGILSALVAALLLAHVVGGEESPRWMIRVEA